MIKLKHFICLGRNTTKLTADMGSYINKRIYNNQANL